MKQWLGKLLGTAGGDGNGNGAAGDTETPDIPDSWKDALRHLMTLTNAQPPHLRAGLGDETIRFLLTGAPESVLAEASQSVNLGQVLGTSGYGHHMEEGFFRHIRELPLPVMLRWTALVNACLSGRIAQSSSSPLYLALPAGARWAEVLMLHSGGISLNQWTSSARPTLPMEVVEQTLAAMDLDPAALLLAAFSPATNWRQAIVGRMPGFADALDRHLDRVLPLLSPASVEARVNVLELLKTANPAALVRMPLPLAALAVGSSRQVRDAAEPLVVAAGDAVVPELQRIAVDEKPDQRQHALRLLHRLGRKHDRQAWIDFAVATAQADKAASVQSLITEWDNAATLAARGEAGLPAFELPVVDWAADLGPSDEVLDRFEANAATAIAAENADLRKRHEEAVARGHKWTLHQAAPIPPERFAALRAYLRGAPPRRGAGQSRGHAHGQPGYVNVQAVVPQLQAMAKAGEVTLLAAIKILDFFNFATDQEGTYSYQAVTVIEALHEREGVSLLLLSQVLADLGGPDHGVLLNYCRSWGRGLGNDWPDEEVWPYAACHLERVIAYLKSNYNDYSFQRASLYRLARTLPVLPPPLVVTLFDLALEGNKGERALAQQALSRYPGKEERAIAALSDGKSDTRAVAAAWLGRQRIRAALPALEQAVRREKQDVAKGAMLDALSAMGQPVENYLDRGALDAEAKKLLAKGVPKDLDWFPWSALPPVRWADNGQALPTPTVHWLLVQAFKQKTPEPNAVLRKYCGMIEPRDRELLGQFVLEAWIGEDLRPISPDDAHRGAAAEAQGTHASMTRYPQYYENSAMLGKSVEEITAMLLPRYLRRPAGSNIGTKGLLAVAAACAAERAAPLVQRYLKEWYGQRAGQGKALIALLAWIEHPSATQLMLAVGSRFRTKGFQEEATRQANALADRKGWTLAELADRTVPSAGFDEAGELTLDFGSRSFTARLLPDFKIELFNPEGKKIAALPEPRQDDDAELAKDAKKALSAAKKELKGIVALQTDRLYEALCTARSWPEADWRAYLLGHPVLRHLVQRLVWVEVDPPAAREDQTADEAAAAAAVLLEVPRVRRAFRPLDDGTLSDVEDDEVTLAEDSHVRLAHDSLLGEDEVRAWLQHLADYEIAPLFQQLGKGVYRLPPERAKDDAVKDFEGHLIETFTLRGRALKLGYVRSAAEDGGWFHRYEKRFPTLGLEAAIHFTGNSLPEENRTAALLSLGFSRQEPGGASRDLPLAQVPAILLSECFNDLRLIAAEGPGFDADWRKKTNY